MRDAVDVVQYQRRPRPYCHSVERIFQDVRASLASSGLSVRVRINRYFSAGVLGRLADAIGASTAQGAVNHVTGDVHYLTYFLQRDRTILTVLDCVGLERMTGLRRQVFRLFWYLIPVRRCRWITVISTFTRDELIKVTGVSADKIVIIPPPVSAEFAYCEGVFNRECPRILQIGTTSNKNIERLAAALMGLECTLVVVGEMTGAQRAAIDDAGLNVENPVGLDRESLLREYERADIVALVSTYEGFGMPIVEANAVGRPVVAGDVCSMPEVAGDAACLVDPTDVQSIRNGILRVISDDEYRKSLVRNGRRNAARFGLDEVAGQYERLYRRVASDAVVAERSWPKNAL